MEILLLMPIILSFILCFYIMPIWIKKCRQTGLLWEDMNKHSHPKNVAASGGLIVVLSFILGTFVYIAIRTFIFKETDNISLKIFSMVSVLLILAITGLTDDMLGWKNKGLSKRSRVLMALLASVPLMVINVGVSKINFPFLGNIDIGLLYPLFLVPLAIVGTSTTYNFLAGFNGLETGQGIIILTFLSIIAVITGSSWLALIGLIMVSSLIAFYLYNKFPAKVFPGDILTYSIGALIAIMAILGNFEKIALFIFIPYIIETILKLRGKLNKSSFGIPDKDNNLKIPYNKIYGLTHLSIFILSHLKNKVKEKHVTYLIYLFQIIICLLSLIIFRSYLFS